jgi:hypothetical protein
MLLWFVMCSDNVDDSELPHHNSDSEGVDEVENEEEELWRRMRHEREMFLQQQKVISIAKPSQSPHFFFVFCQKSAAYGEALSLEGRVCNFV